MKHTLQVFFPSPADNRILGSIIPWLALILVASIGTVRSLIHIFAPDGGAGSIAGMNVAVAGANEVIFTFALWGAEQLIFALIQWLVIVRYRSLVPVMWAFQLLETLGRVLVGHLKPVTFAHIPPGQIGDYVYIVLSLAMLALSLWSGRRALAKEDTATVVASRQ